MSDATITGGEGQLRLSGLLDHASVVALREQGRALIQAGPAQQSLDCAGVTHANSAGLALLLAWLRDAGAAGKTLSIANLPPVLRQIAEVSNVLALLPSAAGSTR